MTNQKQAGTALRHAIETIPVKIFYVALQSNPLILNLCELNPMSFIQFASSYLMKSLITGCNSFAIVGYK